jgi:hypothetical protein
MTPQDALNYIRKNLNHMPLAYQLGFLQGFLAKQISQKPEIGGEFRDQLRAKK